MDIKSPYDTKLMVSIWLLGDGGRSWLVPSLSSFLSLLECLCILPLLHFWGRFKLALQNPGDG